MPEWMKNALLAVFAVVVLTGAAVAVKDGGGPHIAGSTAEPVAPSPSGALPVTERAVIEGQNVVLLRPVKPTAKLVIYVHGRGDDASTFTTAAYLRPTVQALLRAGYMIASSDAHGGGSWGNHASVLDVENLDRWVAGRHSVSDLYLIGQSMGGLASLLALPQLPNVRAWVGIYPACNLAAVADASHFPEIGSAYGAAEFTPSIAPGRSPVRLEGAAWNNLPMLFFASAADTTVPKSSNTDLCASEGRAAGARVTVVTTQGGHGDLSNFQPTRVLAFLQAADS